MTRLAGTSRQWASRYGSIPGKGLGIGQPLRVRSNDSAQQRPPPQGATKSQEPTRRRPSAAADRSALMPSRLNDVEVQVHPRDFARFDLDRTPAVIAQEALLQDRLDLVFPRRQRDLVFAALARSCLGDRPPAAADANDHLHALFGHGRPLTSASRRTTA